MQTEFKEICVSIQAVKGGFIVSSNAGTQVTTSLQKAIGLAREALKQDETETDTVTVQA